MRGVLIFVLFILISAGNQKNIPAPVPLTIAYPDNFGHKIYINADNPTTVEGVLLGRHLFYETALSANNQISCATCHQQARAFTDGKRFSTGVDGTLQDRNTMALVNLLWVNNLFWDGRATGLEVQAKTPLTHPHEMGQSLERSSQKLSNLKNYPEQFKQAFGTDSIDPAYILKALAQFQRTLVSGNSRYDQYLQGTYQPTLSELNGMNLFYANSNSTSGVRGAGCGRCHGGVKTYSELFHNTGLDVSPTDSGRERVTGQKIDRGRFRVVTLRNIALTAPYMHDGRFTTLEEVVQHYSEHVQETEFLSPFLDKLHLTRQETKDIVAFLHLLTDSSFITNPAFANPAQQK